MPNKGMGVRHRTRTAHVTGLIHINRSFTMSQVHTVPAGFMTNMQAAFDKTVLDAPKPFDFDPIEVIDGIRSEGMRRDLFNRLVLSTEGIIASTIRGVLGTIKIDAELRGDHMWDTYQQYMAHVAGLEAEHDWFKAAAMEHPNIPHDLQLLVDLRGECYRKMHGDRIDAEVPTIEHVLSNPRMSNLDADTLTKMEMTADDETSNPEEREEVLAAMQRKEAQQRKLRFQRDKANAGALIALWRAFNCRDDRHEASYDGEFVPFRQMSTLTQCKIMRGMINAASGPKSVITQAESDFRVSAVEFGKRRVEIRAYRKLLDSAAAHAHFDDVRDAVFV